MSDSPQCRETDSAQCRETDSPQCRETDSPQCRETDSPQRRETDSAQYHTAEYDNAARFLRKIRKVSEILDKIENILTHWSEAQVLMMKKAGGRKSC